MINKQLISLLFDYSLLGIVNSNNTDVNTTFEMTKPVMHQSVSQYLLGTNMLFISFIKAQDIT